MFFAIKALRFQCLSWNETFALGQMMRWRPVGLESISSEGMPTTQRRPSVIGLRAPSQPPQALLLKTSSRRDQGVKDGVSQPASHPRPVSRRRLGVGITDLLPGLLRPGPKGPECTVVWDPDKSLTQSIFLELLRSWPNWNGVFRAVNKFSHQGLPDC